MDKSILHKIKRYINSRIFTVTDVVEFDIHIEFLQPKSTDGILDSIKTQVLPQITQVLQTGTLPFLNPTFIKVASKKNDREIDDNSLLEFINNSCYYSINEVDVNSDHVSLKCSIEMIFSNFSMLSDDQLKTIENNVRFKTLMGEHTIENSL